MTTFDVQVTDQDKASAKRRDCYDCPVAEASRAALGWRFVAVAVDGRVVVKDGRGRHVDCRCAEQAEVARFIRAWDDGGDPEGIAFTLECPD